MEVIGYLGPEESYSAIAAEKFRPDGRLRAYPSFPLVFQSLISGETDAVAVPIENTLNGGVLQNIDLLQYTHGVYASEECVVKIEHRLAALTGANYKNIKRVYSHPQALEQCARFLSENFPSAQLVPTNSTAACLEKLTSEEDAGIVGSHVKREGITLSENSIADDNNNFTHFLLIKRGALPENSRSRKIFFSVTCPNRSGALLSLLQRISAHGLNMTKIQSRPVKNVPDEYAFFIEIEGDYSSKSVKTALVDIEKASVSFKILGCY